MSFVDRISLNIGRRSFLSPSAPQLIDLITDFGANVDANDSPESDAATAHRRRPPAIEVPTADDTAADVDGVRGVRSMPST